MTLLWGVGVNELKGEETRSYRTYMYWIYIHISEIQDLVKWYNFSLTVRKRTFWHMRSTKTQISLRIRAVWLESVLSTWRNFASMAIRNAPSEDSDQTARIWIFAGRTCPKVRFLTLQLIWYKFNPNWKKYNKVIKGNGISIILFQDGDTLPLHSTCIVCIFLYLLIS